jgi:hypothetical protein
LLVITKILVILERDKFSKFVKITIICQIRTTYRYVLLSSILDKFPAKCFFTQIIAKCNELSNIAVVCVGGGGSGIEFKG